LTLRDFEHGDRAIGALALSRIVAEPAQWNRVLKASRDAIKARIAAARRA